MRDAVVLMPRLLSGRADLLNHLCFGQDGIWVLHEKSRETLSTSSPAVTRENSREHVIRPVPA